MTTIPLSPSSFHVSDKIASSVYEGLMSSPKWLPSWLFYDAAGSRLFDQITQIPEYYVTRTERSILTAHAAEIVSRAAGENSLRLVELGAGSADKTRLLLSAAVNRQDTVFYEPMDVSASALVEAQIRIENEIPGVLVCPRVQDYTQDIELDATLPSERRLVLYIGSSIGNFEPGESLMLLERVRAALDPGDCLLLGVDLVKDESVLHTAYDDAAGVTAAFNRNVLVRLNRELDADFRPETFAHRAVWNSADSRMEMHLVSNIKQTVWLPAIDVRVNFEAGESIHTENSYKYRKGCAEALLQKAGFAPEITWTDENEWFAVCLARAV
ncbi:L-histidine N(alpha)-methyltransferase [Telmatobacter sp. DSM 110680]|uniref:L-histidine N(Alpha)-methyltransferase n=1 Tax=Telmatobacter sp. DSM 110680 TaxID=3036704 RepID=A0AAU7DNB7_9BACT